MNLALFPKAPKEVAITDIEHKIRAACAGIDSVILYGSHARGDSDILSDIDVLVIAEHTECVREAKDQLGDQGFSCAPYTWNKLQRLVAKRALFLQHLKQEGRVLKDSSGRFARLLSAFRPANDYSREIEDTKHLLQITSRFENSPHGVGWALDVISVAVRNVGILLLANRGRYLFGFDSVLSGLCSEGLVETCTAFQLGKLRSYKALYRSGRYELLPGSDEVLRLQSVLGGWLDRSLGGTPVDPGVFVEDCLEMLGRSRSCMSWYGKVRLCEGMLLALKVLTPNNGGGERDILSYALKVTRAPGDYHHLLASDARDLIALCQRQASRLIAHCARGSAPSIHKDWRE